MITEKVAQEKKTSALQQNLTIVTNTTSAAKDSVSRQRCVKSNSADVEFVGKAGANYSLPSVVCTCKTMFSSRLTATWVPCPENPGNEIRVAMFVSNCLPAH
jgi:hypothetical protein